MGKYLFVCFVLTASGCACELGAEELEHLRRGVRSYLEIKARYLAADDERELGDGSEMWREA